MHPCLRRRVFTIILFTLCLSLITACAGTPTSGVEPTPAGQTNDDVQVVLFLGTGGRGDNSFNDSAVSALPALQNQFNVQAISEDYPRAEDGSLLPAADAKAAQLAAIQRYVEQGYDLIIGIGFENQGVMVEAANAHPLVRFALIDVIGESPHGNLTSVTFREPEGDYILGQLAAQLSETGRVGFIGGADIPVIQRIRNGYLQGVEAANPDVDVTVELVGSFTDTQRAGEIASTMFADENDRGKIDVVYIAAGAAGNEAIKVAVENEVEVLSTSTNVTLPPGITAARPKKVDAAVLFLVQKFLNDSLGETSHYTLGYAEGGVGLAFDSVVSNELQQQMLQLKERIVKGTLVIQVGEDGTTISVEEK